jgi:eukaryotic-like serine/threonine-protein kinase
MLIGKPFQPVAFGRYFLVEHLATGGMAEIYKATSTGAHGFEKTIVIKRILPTLAADSEFVDMFISEAKVTVQLNHPKVVQVLDFGEVDGQYYLAMEYVKGIDGLALLRQCAQRGCRLSTSIAVHIVADVLDALDYAHNLKDSEGKALGIVHRDISPSNIFVSDQGEVKLGDFGIARVAQARGSAETRTLKGKYGYLAPEVVGGAEVDRRADIFSTGIVLAELLMIRRLFVAKSDLEVLLQVRDAKLDRLDKYGKHIPLDLRAILESALARDPNLRYQDAATFRDALHRYLYDHRRMVHNSDVRRVLRRIIDGGPDDLPGESDRASGSGLVPQITTSPVPGAVEPAPPRAAAPSPIPAAPPASPAPPRTATAPRPLTPPPAPVTLAPAPLPIAPRPPTRPTTSPSSAPTPKPVPLVLGRALDPAPAPATGPSPVLQKPKRGPLLEVESTEYISQSRERTRIPSAKRVPQVTPSGSDRTSLEDTHQQTPTGVTLESLAAADEAALVLGRKRRIKLRPPAKPDPVPPPNDQELTGLQKLSTEEVLGPLSSQETTSSGTGWDKISSAIQPSIRVQSDRSEAPREAGEVAASRLSIPFSQDNGIPTPSIVGDLSRESLLRIMFRLALAEETGLLVLQLKSSTKEIFLVDGDPWYVTSSQAEELFGQYLLAKGILAQGELSMALAMLPHFQGKLGDALVALHLLRPVEVLRHLTLQVREKLYSAFVWDEGTHLYYRGRRCSFEAAPLGLDAFEVIGAAVQNLPFEILERRLRPWSDRRPKSVSAPPVPPEVFRMGSLPREVFDRLDGRHTLADHFARFDSREQRQTFARVVYLLTESGLATFA